MSLFNRRLIGLVVIFFVISTSHAVEKKHEFHHPEQFVKSLNNSQQAGKKIYQQFCQVCHAQNPAIKLGAPRIGVKSDWQLRQQKSVDEMLVLIDKGLGAMPPRGGCFECSDPQLKAAIEYLLPVNDKNQKE